MEYIKEVENTGHIKEETFDEARDSALECAKQNIETAFLTEREKKAAKEKRRQSCTRNRPKV